MNFIHRRLCRSSLWQRVLEQHVVPWVLDGVDLGDDVLEVGPGPGLTTDLVRRRTVAVTAVEIDPRFAAALAKRMEKTNATVIEGDATALSFGSPRFSAAVSFTMLHHVPSPELQDRLLREVHRVLRPGGVFVGTDSLMGLGMRLIHVFDTLTPVDPRTFRERLESAGFRDVALETNDYAFRFRAVRGTATA